MVNLYRASLIAFPGEKVMEEAESFSEKYLKETLQKIPDCSLSREVITIINIIYLLIDSHLRPLLFVSLYLSLFQFADRGRFGTWLAHKFAAIRSKELHRRLRTGH